jgi:hypothetical protein
MLARRKCSSHGSIAGSADGGSESGLSLSSSRRGSERKTCGPPTGTQP